MKLAILGVINPTIDYCEWVTIFRRRFGNKTLSQIGITGNDTLLNSFVRKYAEQNSIPISVYNASDASDNAKLARNKALIEDADLLLMFTVRAEMKESRSFVAASSELYGKKALIVFADKSPLIPRLALEAIPDAQPVETKREDLLTVEEEAALAMQIQKGEGDVDAAKAKLQLACQRFVAAVARRYVTAGHSLDGLIEEGNKGLIEAAYKFDPTRGFKFISYAGYWIRHSIEQAIIAR